jgi:superfamily II DNA or RNA helicase
MNPEFLLTKFGVRVPLASISDKTKKKIESDLTVSPIQTDYEFNQIKYKIYLESKNHMYVPRFYFPSFKNEIKSGIRIQLKFEGILKEETHQVVSSKEVIQSLHTRSGCILCLPTGYGKTTVALHVLSCMGTKTLIVVHKEFLLNQWVEKIKQFLPTARIGRIQGPHVDVDDKDIVMGMLQSLSMRDYDPSIFNDFGLTIFDETHHVCTRTFSKVFSKFNTPYVLGLSATIERKDGLTNVLHLFLGEIGYSTKRRNQVNVKVKTITYVPVGPFPITKQNKPNMSEAITSLTIMDSRNTLILNTVKEIDLERKLLILTDRREHCFVLSRILGESLGDERIGLYMGGMKQDELKNSESKSIIIGTFSLAHEGLDIPALDSILLATPKSNIIQAVGRILRETTGKQFNPFIVDIVDMWGPFVYQFKKRKSYYLETGFSINDTTQNKNLLLFNEE